VTTSAAQLHATNDLVAVAWLRTMPGLVADVVATQLPKEETKWAANGAVIVPLHVGGTPHSTMALRRPVVQVETWATVPNSDRLPWSIANQLAEQIRIGCLDRTVFSRLLPITAGTQTYPMARVLSARMLTEPRRTWSDQGDYAGYTFDLAFQWISASGEETP
jgi:hypothetical protein